MSSYAVVLIDDSNKNAINRLFNLINGDSGDTCSQPLSASGQNPPTHWYGGWPVTAEQANALQMLADNLPTPPDDWPIGNGVTEGEAQAAATALYINVCTGEDVEDLPTVNRNAVFAAKGLQPIVPED